MKAKSSAPVLPRQTELALIAATLALNQAAPRAHIMSQAMDWWQDAGRCLEAKASEFKQIARLPMPRKFPATLKRFLQRVVTGKTQKIREARLQQFHEQEYLRPLRVRGEVSPADGVAATREAEAKIADLKRAGFYTKEQWLDLARCYTVWWDTELKRKAREAGARSKKPKK
jgi:hypothetical protein